MEKKQFNPYRETGLTFAMFRMMYLSQERVPNEAYERALYIQFAHETGFGGSLLFLDYNNLFGMKPSEKRHKFYADKVQLATGTFAVYSHPKKSLADRIDLDNYNQVSPPEELADILRYYTEIQEKGYAEDPRYIELLKSLYNQEFGDVPLDTEVPLSELDLNSFFRDKPLALAIPLVIAASIAAYFLWFKKKRSN